MDPQDFDPFNVAASSQVQHAASEEPQTGQARQFEQHLAQASQAAPVASRPSSYPHLSTEDRNFIDSVITQYAAQKKPKPETVRGYTQALRRLGNDLRARGQTTDLANHKSLLEHATTFFPKDNKMKKAVAVLRAYHGTSHLVSREEPRALSSGKDASNDVQQSLGERTDARARSNLLPSEGVLINHEHDAAQSRAAKRQRALPDLEEVVIYRQSSANAASAESSGAPRVAATGVIVRGHPDKRPLYSEDAAVVLKLEHALIEGGMSSQGAHEHGSRLINYSRWLFKDNRPGIVARLDSKSLIDDGAIHKYPGGNTAKLLRSLEYFRTLRATGVVVPKKPGGPRAELNPSPQNVALINPETAALMEPRRIDDAAAQHSVPHQAGTRLEELQEEQDGHPAVSAFMQAQAAFRLEQLPQGELQRLEKQLHDERHGLGDNHSALSFSIDSEDLTLDPELFSLEDLLRPLDDEPAEELQERRDEHSAPSAFIQAQAAFHSEQLPQGELRRVLDHLDDEAMPSAVSDPSEELQRLEKELHDELHGLGDNHPALSFSIDPEEFTFDPEQFSPGELRRLLDAESAEELHERRDDHPAPSAFIQAQAAFHSEQLPQGELRRVLDHLDDEAMPSAVSDPSEELQRLEKQLHDELHGRRDNHALDAPSTHVANDRRDTA
ncbi:hypothetical protein [Bradyrhizobium elkanii]|uniref:hypothetical protein n=1 Tax=Bradyrhizobium elkanii TaxID=29448 RepID=UPI0012BD0D5B|nr:hypothetical protein [Bradyrhizobium elkanii]